MKILVAIMFVFCAAPGIGMAQVGNSYYPLSDASMQPAALPPSVSAPAMQDPSEGSPPPENCCVPAASVAPQDIHTRTQLFGDWFGVRSGLEKRGIVPTIYQTQFYQGVTSGGRVLCAVALGETAAAAQAEAYGLVSRIHWPITETVIMIEAGTEDAQACLSKLVQR